MSTADTVIQFALAQQGKPYQWGATGPNAYDCSGLVQAAFAHAGVSIGRTSYEQITEGSAVPIGQQMPGDLVFPDPGHVQIFIGNGLVVESPHTGANVRVVQQYGAMAVRRIVPPSSTGYDGSGMTNAQAGNIADPAGMAGSAAASGAASLISQIPGLQGTITFVENLKNFFDLLTNKTTWVRIGEVVLGAVILIIGAMELAGKGLS